MFIDRTKIWETYLFLKGKSADVIDSNYCEIFPSLFQFSMRPFSTWEVFLMKCLKGFVKSWLDLNLQFFRGFLGDSLDQKNPNIPAKISQKFPIWHCGFRETLWISTLDIKKIYWLVFRRCYVSVFWKFTLKIKLICLLVNVLINGVSNFMIFNG